MLLFIRNLCSTVAKSIATFTYPNPIGSWVAYCENESLVFCCLRFLFNSSSRNLSIITFFSLSTESLSGFFTKKMMLFGLVMNLVVLLMVCASVATWKKRQEIMKLDLPSCVNFADVHTYARLMSTWCMGWNFSWNSLQFWILQCWNYFKDSDFILAKLTQV